MSRWNEYDKMLENRLQFLDSSAKTKSLPEPSDSEKKAWLNLKNTIMSEIIDGATSGSNWVLRESGWVDVGRRSFHIKNHEQYPIYLNRRSEDQEALRATSHREQKESITIDKQEIQHEGLEPSGIGLYLLIAASVIVALFLIS